MGDVEKGNPYTIKLISRLGKGGYSYECQDSDVKRERSNQDP